MDYPSTTQALFALIVMIIVLLFILVYCCWGSFSCTQRNESIQDDELGAQHNTQQRGSDTSGRMVIVPFSNMIYVGDPDTRRIYQIPVEQDKPPAYTDIIMAGQQPPVPPPPYTSELRPTNADPPPAYDDVLTSSSSLQQGWTTIMLDPSTLDGLDTSVLPSLTPAMPVNRVISQLVLQRCSPPEYSSVDDLFAESNSVLNAINTQPSVLNSNQLESREAEDAFVSNGNRLNDVLANSTSMNSSANTNTGNTSNTNETNISRDT